MSVNESQFVGVKFFMINTYSKIHELISDFSDKSMDFKEIIVGKLGEHTIIDNVEKIEERLPLIKSTNYMKFEFQVFSDDKPIGTIELYSSYWKPGHWRCKYTMSDIMLLPELKLNVNKILKSNGFGIDLFTGFHCISGYFAGIMFLLFFITITFREYFLSWFLKFTMYGFIISLIPWVAGLALYTFLSVNKITSWFKLNVSQIVITIVGVLFGFILGLFVK